MTTTPLEFPSQIDFVQFVSHNAHDLRSPFNRMMGFLKIVLKGQDGPLTALQIEDLNTVYQNSVYAFTMVSNLIDISRLIAGEKSLSLTETGVPSLFQQAVTQWQKYHSELPVHFETHTAAELAPIQADSVLISQAVAGLIACVVECVKLPAQVSLTAEEEPDGLVVTVRSTGKPALNPSRMDLDAYGYISQTLIALHGGGFRQQEAGDSGAVVQFVLPKK
jgi:K+-sensing histidine kinase KdpD